MSNLHKLIRSIAALVIILVAIIPISIISAAATDVIIVDPTPDTTPPVLNSLSISSNQASPGSQITLTADVSDDLSGVNGVSINYKDSSGNYHGVNLWYDQATNKYKGSISFTQYSKSGEWILSNVSINDNKDNHVYYNRDVPNSSFDFSAYDIQVSGGSQDILPPVINTISVAQTQATVGSAIKVYVEATDDSSGIYSTRCYFQTPSKLSTKGVVLYYNQTTGKYEGNFTINQYDELGTWKLYSATVTDNANNSKTVNNSSIQGSYPNSNTQEYRDLSNCNIEVSGTNPDLLPPKLDSLGISLINDLTVKLTAGITDNLSGYNFANASYVKPNGNIFNGNFYKDSNGKYVISIPIDKYDQLGTWKLNNVSMYDNQNNHKTIYDNSYNYDYMEKMDFSPFDFIVRRYVTIPPASPFSVAISPKTVNLEPGESQQLQSTLNFTDGTTKDITEGTNGTSYTSSNSSAVKVDNNGVIKVASNASPGIVYIQALNGGLYDQCEVIISGGVAQNQIQVTPLSLNLAPGQSKQLNVIESLIDGTAKDVTLGSSGTKFSSSDNTMVTVDQNGLLYALPNAKQGTVKIEVDNNGVTAEVSVNVTGPITVKGLAMTPAMTTLGKGETIQLSIRAIMTDGTTKDVTVGTNGTTYATSDASRATVSKDGLITIPVTATSGTVNIKASNNGFDAQSVITVTEPTLKGIQADQSNITLAPGETHQLSVKAAYSDGSELDVSGIATYKSFNTSLVQVSNSGLITIPNSAIEGVASLKINYGGQDTYLIITVKKSTQPVLNSLEITPNPIALLSGGTQQLVVNAVYSDGTKSEVTGQSTYISFNTTLAQVSSGGLISIPSTASDGAATLKVGYGGKTKSLIITVSKPTVAVVNSIGVTPNSITLEPGKTQQLIVKANNSDGSSPDVTGQATYTSTNTSLAQVNSSGLVSIPITASSGATTIKVSYSGKTSYATVNVAKKTLKGIEVTPTSINVTPGGTQQLVVNAVYSDGTKSEVTGQSTYTSFNTGLVQVSGGGLISIPSTASDGAATLKVSYGGQTKSLTITVSKPIAVGVSSIGVTPNSITLEPGKTQQLTVKANNSDGSSVDVTGQATYTSTNTSLAQVNSSGLISIPSTASNGATTIKVSYSGKTSYATVNIAKKTLKGIEVTPTSINVIPGGTQQLVVNAVYSDGTKSEVTGQSTYTSFNTGLVQVSGGGLISIPSTASDGAATLKVSYGGQTKSLTITVSKPITVGVSSIGVTPNSITLEPGKTQQLTVKANNSDGSSVDVTGQATYTSTNTSLAQVNSSGLVSIPIAASSGATTIKVSYSGKTSYATVNVAKKTLKGIEVTPTSINVTPGGTQQLVVNAVYSDGTKSEVTGQSTYTSFNTGLVQVSSGGLISIPSTASDGAATLKVSYGDQSQYLTVTVSK